MFKDRLRYIREEMGLTQAEFSNLVNVSAGAQTNYERGIRYPDVLYLEALIAQGVDIQFLLTGIPSSSEKISNEEKFLLLSYRQAKPEERTALLSVAKAFYPIESSQRDFDHENRDQECHEETHNKKEVSTKKRRGVSFSRLQGEYYFNRTLFFFQQLLLLIGVALLMTIGMDSTLIMINRLELANEGWITTIGAVTMLLLSFIYLFYLTQRKLNPLCSSDC